MGATVRLGIGLLMLALTATAVAAAGGRDPSYGTNGVASVFSDSGGAHVIELAPDGTIVGLAGETASARLYRAFGDGSLDPSFGMGGILDLPNDNYTGLVVAPDGKILLTGVTSGGAWFIRRLDASGTPDPGFGTGGEVVSDFGPNYDYPYNLTILDDGRLVVSGTVYPDVALARYGANGALDTSFGMSGLETYDFGGGAGEFLGRVVEQPDGKLVAGLASTFGSAVGAFAVVRFEEDGSLDTGFGTTAPGYTKVTTPGGAFGTSTALTPDGRIYLTGIDDYDIPSRSFTLLRFLDTGGLDPDFGTGGIATADWIAGEEDESRFLQLLPDGKVLVVGQARIGGEYQIMMLRFLTNGDFDGSFGLAGAAYTPVDDFSQPVDAVLLPDGDVLVAGSSFPVSGVRNFTERITMCGGCDTVVPGGCVTSAPGACWPAGTAKLTIRKDADSARDLFTWKYKKGPATAGADFGDPPAGDDLAFCLWFQSSVDGIIPLMRTTLVGGDTCGTRPCWKGLGSPAGTKGYRRTDRTRRNDGIASVTLKAATDARTTITVKAKGGRIRLPAMPLGASVKARLQSPTGECWEAIFPSGSVDTAWQYEGKTP